MINTVTRALNGAARVEVPTGTSSRRPKTVGINVAGISMMTVPETVGVRSRRNSESRAESASGTSDATTTRVASNAGPPSATAVMLTATTAREVPITAT